MKDSHIQETMQERKGLLAFSLLRQSEINLLDCWEILMLNS
jgi:hypothetical protein